MNTAVKAKTQYSLSNTWIRTTALPLYNLQKWAVLGKILLVTFYTLCQTEELVANINIPTDSFLYQLPWDYRVVHLHRDTCSSILCLAPMLALGNERKTGLEPATFSLEG